MSAPDVVPAAAVDLSALTLPELRALEREVSRQAGARTCRAALRNGPSCLLEKGTHQHHKAMMAGTPDGSAREVFLTVLWDVEDVV